MLQGFTTEADTPRRYRKPTLPGPPDQLPADTILCLGDTAEPDEIEDVVNQVFECCPRLEWFWVEMMDPIVGMRKAVNMDPTQLAPEASPNESTVFRSFRYQPPSDSASLQGLL